MQILYIIGNGFDINLGLKTRYSDFYKYYQSIYSKNELITTLKKNMTDSIVNWSDLELEFGKYTINLKTLDDFDVLYEDIVDNLADYLEAEEQKFDSNNVDVEKFLTNLHTPEMYLAPADMQDVKEFKDSRSAAPWKIDIVTLNYTRTIERILQNKTTNNEIGKQRTGHSIILRGLQHIHGYTDERTIMGVNDVSQVGQLNFHTNREILEALVKPNSNKSQRHNIDKKCEAYISKAELICIFGSSIGDTDKHWWNLIGQQLRKGTKLIIFSKGEEIKGRFAHKPLRTQRSIKKHFLDRTDLTDQERQEFDANIFVGVNTAMFSILSGSDI